MVPAVCDHDVPVWRDGQALGAVQRAGGGVHKSQEGTLYEIKFEYLKKNKVYLKQLKKQTRNLRYDNTYNNCDT